MLGWLVLGDADQKLRPALRDRERGRGKRIAPSVRRLVLAHVARRQRGGDSLRVLSAELGIGFETLRRWLAAPASASTRQRRRKRPPAALVPVAVVPALTAARARLVSVVSPSGYRVDGVTLDEAALLLRALA
mgnify:CR=1 FL=1